MARTQAIDYEEKRSSIAAAAAPLFAQYGFAGASISELARACSLSKSSIYHYFDSKEDILYEVMTEHIDNLLKVTEPEEYIDIGEAERFEHFAVRLLNLYAGQADSQKVLLYELNSLPSQEREEIVQKQRKLIDFASDLLAQTGQTEKDNLTLVRTQVMLFFGMINWSQSWLRDDGPYSRDTIARFAARAVSCAAPAEPHPA